jgi:hypothetical protein
MRRLLRQHRQRGAALFIVVMVITLLTAIGLFAIRAASLTNVATGYLRQQVQTAQLAEYASRVNVITKLSDPSLAQYTLQLINTGQSRSELCYVNRNVDTTGMRGPGCHVNVGDDFTQQLAAFDPNMTLLDPQTATTAGSFGPPLTAAGDLTSALEGRIRVEMHDPYEGGALISGVQVDGDIGSMTLTMTTFAQIRMTGAGTSKWCPDPVAGPSASMQAMRAHITLPVAVRR